MPELPEVETVARHIDAQARGQICSKITFYRQDLRDPIPVSRFKKVLLNQPITQVFRRSKYILMETSQGYGLFHLGMTGNILWLKDPKPTRPHTHLIMQLRTNTQKQPSDTHYLHFIDPRRFGQIHAWEGEAWHEHPYLANLGPEPLAIRNLGAHLYQASRKRSVSIKAFLMDATKVVGVGNIYACEALFSAGIHPEAACGRLSEGDYQRLSRSIKATLRRAITAGGTTLRDFKDGEGNPGYFAVELTVYGRDGEPCYRCNAPIRRVVQGGRGTWFCATCQNGVVA